VTKYVTNSGYAFATVGALMNLKKWNELPSDTQKIILDCSVEAQRWSREEAQKMDRECLGLLSGRGMEIYIVPEKEREMEKSRPARHRYFLKKNWGKG
jgi:TRAP-type C4-dicarboxylate transport system substrate-binding protein